MILINFYIMTKPSLLTPSKGLRKLVSNKLIVYKKETRPRRDEFKSLLK